MSTDLFSLAVSVLTLLVVTAMQFGAARQRLDAGEKANAASAAEEKALAEKAEKHASKLIELCTRVAALEETVRRHDRVIETVGRLEERVILMQTELHRLYQLISMGRKMAIDARVAAAGGG